MKRSILLLSGLFLLAGCSKPTDFQTQTADHDGARFEKSATPAFTVVNDLGQPIAEAQILIGKKVGEPFNRNFLTTNAQGTAELPDAWTGELPVTIQAPGHIRATFFDGAHGDRTFNIRRADSAAFYELNGTTSGYGSLPRDGQVDFGLMIAAINKQKLFKFDLEMVISPEIDVIEIIGKKLEIPSNVALPKQKETYILPITLEKEKYRIYYRDQGKHTVFAARGQFPLKDVADQLKNGTPFYNLINYFKFMTGTVTAVDIQGKKTSKNLTVNAMNFSKKLSIQAPRYPGEQVAMAVALSDINNNLYPSDVKKLSSGQTQRLNLPDQGSPIIASILALKADFEKQGPLNAASVVVAPFVDKFTPDHLAMVPKPEVLSRNELRLTPPSTVNGVAQAGTYAVLSKVESRVEAGASVQKTRLWEAYGLNWANHLQLPEWPQETLPTRGLRWEVTFIGSPGDISYPSGPELLEKASHVSYSSKDF